MTWERIEQIRREKEEAARRGERERQEAQDAARRVEEERKSRAQQLLDESGATRSLREVRTGMPHQPHADLEVSQDGSAELQFGRSDKDYSRIRVSADPQTDAITIGRKRIPAEEWRSDQGIIEDAVAKAYLSPEEVHLPTPPPTNYGYVPYEPLKEPTGLKRFLKKISDTGKREPYDPPTDPSPCLSKGSLILTPNGNVKVETLRVGDIVWSADAKGKKIKARIKKIAEVTAGDNHKMLKIKFINGVTISVSPEHPDKNGNPLINTLEILRIGDLQIENVEIIKYKNKFTYDILPDGPTGAYWVSEILLGSTLFANYHYISHSLHS